MTSFAVVVVLKYCQALKYSHDWLAAKKFVIHEMLSVYKLVELLEILMNYNRDLLCKRQRKWLVLPAPLFGGDLQE